MKDAWEPIHVFSCNNLTQNTFSIPNANTKCSVYGRFYYTVQDGYLTLVDLYLTSVTSGLLQVTRLGVRCHHVPRRLRLMVKTGYSPQWPRKVSDAPSQKLPMTIHKDGLCLEKYIISRVESPKNALVSFAHFVSEKHNRRVDVVSARDLEYVIDLQFWADNSMSAVGRRLKSMDYYQRGAQQSIPRRWKFYIYIYFFLYSCRAHHRFVFSICMPLPCLIEIFTCLRFATLHNYSS